MAPIYRSIVNNASTYSLRTSGPDRQIKPHRFTALRVLYDETRQALTFAEQEAFGGALVVTCAFSAMQGSSFQKRSVMNFHKLQSMTTLRLVQQPLDSMRQRGRGGQP